jgi:hypothetical protein
VTSYASFGISVSVTSTTGVSNLLPALQLASWTLELKMNYTKCPICSAAKLRKANKGTEDSRRATVCNQGISIDAGFIVQSSKDSKRVAKYTGLNGDSFYFLIVDHKSETVYGETFASKAPPIEFINRWLAQNALGQDVPDKYVCMDLGGELGSCPEVVNLFERSGHKVETIAAQSSSQNGPGEQPHQTIANAMRSMLVGAGLPAKFWPYAFLHYLRLYNLIPHAGKEQSPYEICSSQKPDLS